MTSEPHTLLEITPVTDPLWRELAADNCVYLYEYWVQAKGDAAVPDWSDFHFMDLYRIAPNLIVIDVHPELGVDSAYYRFVGTGIVELRRLRGLNDPTGENIKSASRVYDRNKMDEACNECTFHGRPVHLRGPYVTERRTGSHDRIILPWCIDGRVQRLTAVVDKYPDRPFAG